MKLLVILNDLDIGGAQNYTIGLLNEFVKLGHEISLRILSNNLLLKDRLAEEIKVIAWPRQRKLDFSILKKIRLDIKNNKYTGIIASYVIYQKLATLFLHDIPTTIYPIHSTIEKNKKSYILNLFMYRFKRANEIYLTSIDSQTKFLTASYRLKIGFFQQIYNGIDIEKIMPPPIGFSRNQFLKSIGVETKHKIILMVAGYREEKRHIDAIKAFQLLEKDLDNVSLICVGDNRIKNRDILQTYIDINNIQNIKLLIASEAGDIMNYYWSSHIFTLTSNKIETFPISALEAMACGLPCVLTNIGGASDIIIPEKNGLLCEANNIQNIKNKWAHVLKHHENYNKDFIRNIVVDKYSIKKSANEYLQLFN
jgi:glycosyltransferase involved in cell wall biosynthesis